jgi:hypothetical protein
LKLKAKLTKILRERTAKSMKGKQIVCKLIIESTWNKYVFLLLGNSKVNVATVYKFMI